jgi:hypothetical protein
MSRVGLASTPSRRGNQQWPQLVSPVALARPVIGPLLPDGRGGVSPRGVSATPSFKRRTDAGYTPIVGLPMVSAGVMAIRAESDDPS